MALQSSEGCTQAAVWGPAGPESSWLESRPGWPALGVLWERGWVEMRPEKDAGVLNATVRSVQYVSRGGGDH